MSTKGFWMVSKEWFSTLLKKSSFSSSGLTAKYCWDSLAFQRSLNNLMIVIKKTE
jgi:hypothetical protein